jgi:hypothetical protein
LDAFLAGSGGDLRMMTMATTTTKTRGDFDDHDDGNNDHKDNVNNDARTTSTSFLTQQPTCGRIHSWKGGGGDFNDNEKKQQRCLLTSYNIPRYMRNKYKLVTVFER